MHIMMYDCMNDVKWEKEEGKERNANINKSTLYKTIGLAYSRKRYFNVHCLPQLHLTFVTIRSLELVIWYVCVVDFSRLSITNKINNAWWLNPVLYYAISMLIYDLSLLYERIKNLVSCYFSHKLCQLYR